MKTKNRGPENSQFLNLTNINTILGFHRLPINGYQDENDSLMESNELKLAYNTDVSPILAMYRMRAGGAIDPIATYRSANYRKNLESARPSTNSNSSGIV